MRSRKIKLILSHDKITEKKIVLIFTKNTNSLSIDIKKLKNFT